MKPAVVATWIALLACVAGNAAAQQADKTTAAQGPAILTEDVDSFYRIYDAAGGHPTAVQLQRDYLDAGTEGLRAFAGLRNTTGERIAEAIARQPQIYADARRCAAALPQARRRLAVALDRLRGIYPSARLPDVTVAIGRGKPVAIGSPVTGLQIGLEALCGVTYFDADVEDRFVHVAAHEYVHVQQPREMVDDSNPTVLEGSLVEGAAEFVGELVSGGRSYARQAADIRGLETALETAFVADQDKRDLSDWLYNGTIDKPGDLGYWVGYRIVKSYYEHATDKRAAIREIIEMRDPKEFLARSQWHPGIAL